MPQSTSNQSLPADTPKVKIDMNENNTSIQMCEAKYKLKIYTELNDYMEQNYEKGDNVEDMVEEAIQSLWNGDYNEPVVEEYEHITFFLKIIKENEDDYGIAFNNYNDPQKIFNLGMYLLAKQTEEDFIEKYETINEKEE